MLPPVDAVGHHTAMRLGPEWRGRLPPWAVEQLGDTIRGLIASGLVAGCELVAGPGCDAGEADESVVYALRRPPDLPRPGCRRKPCCACGYVSVLPEDVKGRELRAGSAEWAAALGL